MWTLCEDWYSHLESKPTNGEIFTNTLIVKFHFEHILHMMSRKSTRKPLTATSFGGRDTFCKTLRIHFNAYHNWLHLQIKFHILRWFECEITKQTRWKADRQLIVLDVFWTFDIQSASKSDVNIVFRFNKTKVIAYFWFDVV